MADQLHGVHLRPEDIVKIIEASTTMGAALGQGPQPLWCGIGCGGHASPVRDLELPEKRPERK